MTDEDTRGLHRKVGELTGTITALVQTVERMGATMAHMGATIHADMEKSEDKAEDRRRVMHLKMDEMSGRVSSLEHQVETVTTKVGAIETITNDVRALRDKASGAGALGRWLIRFGGWVLSAALGIVTLYTWITGRPPP